MPESTGVVLAKLISVVHRCSRTATLRLPEALSPSAYRTLALARDRGPVRLGELAELVRVSQPGMTKIVAALSADGLLTRIADPEDLRARTVSITATGIEFLGDYARELGAALTEEFADLSPDELTALANATDILLSRLDR
ncbi:MarR family winged helix-turn-helix transcriptional regulator [Pseudactinotalea sp. HY158]|uniref:MarR family winged helix-turn-helix transcriptional regulator n=1 Tax=Pseudactinotalea sp. HY158 TaxID=2654547 RepID=UPI00129CEB35|nr:MarR family transcriptional regulator [Pseudactinotalea sp. HY158]QGH68989.1 MarR family transcriptional regulator [Pseudactinotalea sp. HY158]